MLIALSIGAGILAAGLAFLLYEPHDPVETEEFIRQADMENF